jgi:nicotinate-nucleotide--dimethylbenzimidazole phosphoribosyltransferase
MSVLKETLDEITARDKDAVKKAWKHIDNLTKPLGSLGELEEIPVKHVLIM